ncbi:DUF2513 domain-containing protein [uncultured Roseobacter sp.]|uniref:DUF2513 domain-containing protein n=1 Tax=uncultured Roseobacter sp. TaxID=114847 RepID=UPI0026022469|nr:DUF2513 domain-containing protein [uncultured Roseobacter sp.]
MRRDDDFARDLLFRMEAQDDYYFMNVETLDSDLDDQKERYHLLLLEDAGLVVRATSAAHSFRLTNSGHDFIEVTRNDTVWIRVKDVAANAGGATLKMLGEIAVQLAKRKLLEATGMEI